MVPFYQTSSNVLTHLRRYERMAELGRQLISTSEPRGPEPRRTEGLGYNGQLNSAFVSQTR